LWIAIMKEDLTRDALYKIVREQAKVFRTGKVFDKTAGEFKLWKRKRVTERLYRKRTAGKRSKGFAGRLGAARIRAEA